MALTLRPARKALWARYLAPSHVPLADACEQATTAMLAVLPATDAHPQRLHEAMHYALMGGGKQVRPALVLGSCRAAGGGDGDCQLAMAAVEILHTYTLVHDDLPAMTTTICAAAGRRCTRFGTKPRRSWWATPCSSGL